MTEVSPEFESTIMELLVFSGSARSNALMALRQRAPATSPPRPNTWPSPKSG